MPTEIERLVVSLEASITKYEKAMARAAGIGDQRAKQIEKRFTGLETSLKNFGKNALSGFVTGAGSAVAAALSLTAVINGTKAALQQFGDIADQSAAAGVDPEFFQGIAYQAKLAGVEVGGVASALATFNKNSGQLEEGRGRLVTLLKDMNPELLRQIQLATTQEQRFLLVADAIAKSESAAGRAALAAAAFGDQGTKLVAVLANGADEIDRLNRNAKEMGIIVDRDLIGRADELGDKLDIAATIVQTRLNVALVDLAPLLVDAAGLAAQLARSLSIAYEVWSNKPTESRQFIGSLQKDLADTYDQMRPISEELARLQAQLTADGGENWRVSFDISEAETKLDALTARANELLSRVQELQGYKPPTAPVAATPGFESGMLGRGGGGRVNPMNGMKGRGGPGRINPVEPFYGPGSPGYEAGLRSTKSAADAAGESLVRTTSNLDDLGDKALDVQQTMQSFAQGFISDLLNGESAVDSLIGSLGDLAKQLASTFLNNGISQLLGGAFGTGGIGGLKGLPGIGGLNGSVSFRAAGGPVSAGRPYVVGEKRPELFVPSQSGMILPGLPGAGRGQKVVNNVFNYGTDKVEQRQNSTGGIDTIIGAVEQRIKGNMAKGKYRQFGVDPGMVRR